MKVAFLILLIGALSIPSSDAQCGLCGVKHPQQHLCDADFAMKLTILNEVHESDLSMDTHRLYNAEILRSWKRGPGSGEFQFYVPASICGSTFTAGETYVVTGTRERTSDGRRYWLHGSCDYMSAWDDMSAQQKTGFAKKGYASQCEACEGKIHTTYVPSAVTVDEMENNDYREAATYWTPTDCFYNPLMTRQYAARKGVDIEDCEGVYGLCQRNRAGECQWKMTAGYKKCFKKRDDFVVVESGAFAVTDISQCDIYTNRRKRKTCRERFLEEQAQLGADEESVLHF